MALIFGAFVEVLLASAHTAEQVFSLLRTLVGLVLLIGALLASGEVARFGLRIHRIAEAIPDLGLPRNNGPQRVGMASVIGLGLIYLPVALAVKSMR